jgi:hypothetical protein
MNAIVELIPIALQKTKEGKLEWEALSRGGSFVARLGDNSSIEVGYTRDEEERFALLDSSGRILESTRWGEIGSPYDDHLRELTNLARRKALRVDETLKDAKGFLSKL